jgi:L-seryl-tRNA(Ser) seleniumtransferase
VNSQPADQDSIRVRGASLAAIPSVDRLLNSAELAPAVAQYGRSASLNAARVVTAALRQQLGTIADTDKLSQANPADQALGIAAVAAMIVTALEQKHQARLRNVLNLTGTVLHTNLGRAVLAQEAIDAITQAASAPVNLEYDLQTGTRGERDGLIESLVTEVTGAPACTVVNNNAAAVLLVLSALASKREVIISRGELIEIGGSFRIPDIMTRAQAKLIEVGTTNRTHRADYENAISPRSAVLMRVHTSNYVVSGFTASVPTAALAEIAQANRIAMVEDLGSGTLVDLTRWGLPYEPTVQDALQAGADLVTFSGDKLLGGPQAGLIVGRADLIARINKHPLKRALRVDKLTIAALEATLRLYLNPDRLAERLPTLRVLACAAERIRPIAAAAAQAIGPRLAPTYSVEVIDCASMIGSGAQPVARLPSVAVAIAVAAPAVVAKRSGRQSTGRALQRLERALRELPVPVIGRIADDRILLDCRMLDNAAPLIDAMSKLQLSKLESRP